MISFRITLLACGFAMLLSSTGLSQSQLQSTGGVLGYEQRIGNTPVSTQSLGNEARSINPTNANNAPAHWWQRGTRAPSQGSAGNSSVTTVATTTPGSAWSLGSLLGASNAGAKPITGSQPQSSRPVESNPAVLAEADDAVSSENPFRQDPISAVAVDASRAQTVGNTQTNESSEKPFWVEDAATHGGSPSASSDQNCHRLPKIDAPAGRSANGPPAKSVDVASSSVAGMFRIDDATMANSSAADQPDAETATATTKSQSPSQSADVASNAQNHTAIFANSLANKDRGDGNKTAADSIKESVHTAFIGLIPTGASADAKVVGMGAVQPNKFPMPESGANARPMDAIGPGTTSIPPQSGGNPFNRAKIIYHPVAIGTDNVGHKMLRPDVRLAYEDEVSDDPSQVRLTEYAEVETMPAPMNPAPETAYPVEGQWMPPVVADDYGYGVPCDDCNEYGGWNGPQGPHGHHGHGKRCGNVQGIGPEYVMHAPFFLDRTQPYNHCYVRGDAASNLEFPDRIEYFWAKTPGGNGPVDPRALDRAEPSVNYQDVVFYIEKGTDRISVGTKLPIRSVDPEFRLNSTGFADMEITSKAVFLDGTCWQLTQIFTTHLPTGSAHRGTGDGHVSLEPGVAWRYKWSDYTYINGDLTYWFPIAADPEHSGQMFNYGIGISHVWIDTDKYAIIPTFEVEAWTILDGRQTVPFGPLFAPDVQEIDSMGIVNIAPGLRWVCDRGCDCGIREFGISGGIAVTENHWYEEILRLEFRWSR